MKVLLENGNKQKFTAVSYFIGSGDSYKSLLPKHASASPHCMPVSRVSLDSDTIPFSQASNTWPIIPVHKH
ncbi:MAG TPA: hypothetical protein VIH09_12240 [Flavobacterium sp.]|uniref:hypothetical protein n=1 Tax=Flavobacterium sp. TaxID=239 RepID=UPI002F42C49E